MRHPMNLFITHLGQERLLQYQNMFHDTGRDQFLQSKALEVLGEEAGELAPLGVVAGQKHRLAAKRVGIEVEIGVDLLLDVIILRIELTVLRILRLGQQPVLTLQLLSVRFLTQYIKLPRKRS